MPPPGAGPAPDPHRSDPREEATRCLRAWSAGDAAARAPLLELLYGELRRQAAGFLARERAGHTLQPTALVHEAWVRLVRADDVALESRAHFLGLAARAMREVLVDHARARLRDKRGGGGRRVELGTDLVGVADDGAVHAERVLAVEEGLGALRALSARQADVVELRFFGGLTEAEVAEVLGVSVNTVDRDWRVARAWLAQKLGADGAP